MRVGVVIPAYRVAAFVGEAVASLQAQTHSDWEAVVVDDGCPEDSGSAAERIGDARVQVIRQANTGVSAARNAGAAALPDADALLFLDGDDTLTPSALAELASLLRAEPSASAAFGAVIHTDAEGNEIGRSSRPQRRWSLRDVAHQSPCPCPGGYLIRSTAFRVAGGFDQRFSYAADWHLVTLVARSGVLIGTPSPVVRYRRHSAAMTQGDQSAGHQEIRDVRLAVYQAASNNAADRRAMRAAWRRHNLLFGAREARAGKLHRAGARLALAAWGRPVRL